MIWRKHHGKALIATAALVVGIGTHTLQAGPEIDNTAADRMIAEEVANRQKEIGNDATAAGNPAEDSDSGAKEEPFEEEPAEEDRQGATMNQAGNEQQTELQQPRRQQPPPEPEKTAALPVFNSYVLNLIKTYPNYPYLLNNDYQNYNGVTTTLEYRGRVLARAHPSGNRANHCVGITFEVFFKAMQQRNKDLGRDPEDFGGLTWDELFDFLLHWYGAAGPGSNIVTAVEKYGFGYGITNLEQALPGDFLYFSRENNTGHTVVFIDWLRDGGGRIIGVHYWSSQQSTNGIAYKEEYFNVRNAQGQKYGNVKPNSLRLARVQPRVQP